MLLHQLKEYKDTIFIDTETDGLYGTVELVQIYCPSLYSEVHSYSTKTIGVETILNAIKDVIWIGHNLAYDFSVLRFKPCLWEDTFLLSKIAFYEEESLSLDKCLEKVLGYNPYEEANINKKAMQKSNWINLTDEQLQYAELDVKHLPTLFKQVYKDSKSYRLDKRTIEVFHSMKQALPINREKLMERQKENTEKVEALGCPINVNSSQQVKKYLNNFFSNGDLDLARMIATEEGEIVEKASLVRKTRSLLKQNSFITKFLRSGDYLYGHLNVVPRSGRSNCSEQNLQQIPGSLKSCIESKKYLVYADFAQLELRMLAAVIGERVLEKLFKADEDLHNYAASQLFGPDFTKDKRQIAKIYNFASAYGASSNTIRDVVLKWSGVFVDDTQASINRTKWLDAYRDIALWHKRNVKAWKAGEAGCTTLGRPYKAKLYTDMNNIMISGSAAEVAKYALVLMSDKLDMSKMLMFIHDSYTYEADTLEEGQLAAGIIAESMQSAWRAVCKACVIKDIPMPVKVSIDKNWKKADSDEAEWSKKYD